jgi:hypothetical protein
VNKNTKAELDQEENCTKKNNQIEEEPTKIESCIRDMNIIVVNSVDKESSAYGNLK